MVFAFVLHYASAGRGFEKLFHGIWFAGRGRSDRGPSTCREWRAGDQTLAHESRSFDLKLRRRTCLPSAWLFELIRRVDSIDE